MTDRKELENRITHHTPNQHGTDTILANRKRALEWSNWMVENVPPGREQGIALEHIEEALFWSNAGIAREGRNQA